MVFFVTQFVDISLFKLVLVCCTVNPVCAARLDRLVINEPRSIVVPCHFLSFQLASIVQWKSNARVFGSSTHSQSSIFLQIFINPLCINLQKGLPATPVKKYADSPKALANDFV